MSRDVSKYVTEGWVFKVEISAERTQTFQLLLLGMNEVYYFMASQSQLFFFHCNINIGDVSINCMTYFVACVILAPVNHEYYRESYAYICHIYHA